MRILKLELTRSEECYIIALAILINGHNSNWHPIPNFRYSIGHYVCWTKKKNVSNSLIGFYNLFTIRAFKGCSKDEK